MPCIEPRAARASFPSAAVALALALAGCHSPMPPDTGSHPVTGVVPMPAAPARPYARAAQTAGEYKLQIASKLVAANPGITYTTPAVNPLFAIPALEIEVNADGSVRAITVARKPSDPDAQDTIQIAIDAVRRAAPFGDATHVPRPWKFNEVFLFDEQRRFKPRELD